MEISLSQTPFGITTKQLPMAELASAMNSKDLVSDNEHDSYFFRSLEKLGTRLNKAQIEAVRHGEGPILTLAGAGSGKTSVLVSRTGYLLSVREIDASKILLVTFTRKAAGEMKERIGKLPGISAGQVRQITAGTFHSFFLGVLRSHGYKQKILSNEKQKQTIVKVILKEMGLDDAYQPESLLALFSSYKGQMMSANDFPAQTPVEKEIRHIFGLYEKWKQHNDMIDFDDILLEALSLFKSNSNVLRSIQHTYHYIMVDEFQDCNLIQYELIKMVALPQNNLMVVGDDDQTIFSFNGADFRYILDFQKTYPDAKIVTLDINYRSNNAIVGLGNQIIRNNQLRHIKKLSATRDTSKFPTFSRPQHTDDEAESVINMIREQVRQGKKYKDFAILHRTITSSRAMMEQLVLENIPFVSYSSKETFYETGIVKPVLDYLRVAINPKDYTAIQGLLPTLYISKDSGMEFIIRNDLAKSQPFPLVHLLGFPGLKKFQKDSIMKKIQMISGLKKMKTVDAVKQVRIDYDKYLDANERGNLTLHKEMIRETLDELETSAKRFDSIPNYIKFIDDLIEMNKKMEDLRNTPNVDAVSLMTIHKSKGLEFDSVFLIGASEGILPHSSSLEADSRDDMVSVLKGQKKVQAAIEEERRLAYVAVTRAKENLYISSPELYRGKTADISRFLMEAYKSVEPLTESNNIPKSEAESRISEETSKMKVYEEALVWVCSNDTCEHWERISNFMQAKRRCRDCGFEMQKEKKQFVWEI